jgi:uncharacterized membrane protein
MNTFLRVLRQLSMVVWVGGLIFFAFVEAPTAVRVMGTNSQFAQLIDGSITALNRLGHAAGLIFLIASLLLWLRSPARARGLILAQVLLVMLMIAATIHVQHVIRAPPATRRASTSTDCTPSPRS